MRENTEKEKEHTRAEYRKGKGAYEREYGRGEYGRGKGAYKRRIRKRKRSIQEQNTEKEKEHMRENTEEENME